MAQEPDQKARNRIVRTPFATMADRLYSEDDQKNPLGDDAEQDFAFDEEQSDGASVKPMSPSDVANKMYPDNAQTKDEAKSQDEDQDNEDTEEDGSDDENDPEHGEHGEAAQRSVNRLNSVLQKSGIGQSPHRAQEDADGAAKLEAGMRKTIADAEARKGEPLTPDEEESIAGAYIAVHAQKWLGLRKLSETMWRDSGPKPNGGCGEFFKRHFEAAGARMAPPDKRSHSAKDWGPELEKNGYQKLSPENYVPQDGDIRIFSSVAPKDPKNPKAAEIHGHIQVYNAKQKAWVSEYQQNGNPKSEIPRAFRERPDAKYTNYRFNAF